VTPAISLRDVLAELLNARAPLAEKLAAYAARQREASPALAAAYDALIERLRAGKVGAGAPDVGDPWPHFMLPDEKGRLARSERLLAQGPLVVSFNRGHWCPWCRLELRDFAEHLGKVRALGAQFVSILPERQPFFSSLLAGPGQSLHLLSDIDLGYTLSLGLAYWLGDDVIERYRAVGLRLDRFHGNNAWFLPVPATYVVGRNSCVTARFIDPDFRKRMAIEDVVAALEIA
jgi:peroxiredoxin